MNYQNTNMVALSANHGYAIFFDNVRVDQFTENFSVNLGIEIGMGAATVNMIYVPDFDKVIHKMNNNKVENITEQAVQSKKEIVSEKVSKAEVVNCSRLTVRNGPSANANAIAWLDKGDKVTVLGRGGDNNYWVKIKTPQGKEGWIGGNYARLFDDTVINKGAEAKEVKKQSTPAGAVGDVSVDKGLNVVIDDGIENMTNVRVYIKNIFSGKYQQVFGGNITSKSISIQGKERKLSFMATDFMNWLNKTVCPVAIPLDSTITLGDRLKWKAQGIDISKVNTVSSVNEISFKGKTLSQTWQMITDQALKSNALYSNKETVAYFDNPLSKVIIMGDIDEDLRRKEVIDFLIVSSMTQVNSVYVMMNDIIRQLLFEFYQDIDESIKIKPPFWNQHVLKNHVIDPALINAYTESTNYNSMYTRVIATGGLDEWHRTSSDRDLNALIQSPVVAVTSSGLASNSGPTVLTTELQNQVGMQHGSNIATSAVAIAQTKLGKPYIWGATGPDRFDCSGLIDYCYKQAGYTGFGSRETTSTLVNRGRAVVNTQDLRPGDLLFPRSTHVVMYIGNGRTIEAGGGDDTTTKPTAGAEVMYGTLKKSYKNMRRIVEWDGIANVNENTPVIHESVGADALLEPTLMEKKYGPKIYDCSQPLIKFSTSAATNSDGPYDALSKYARFMLNYLNSNVVIGNLQTEAMPWIRPGFNIWVDPVSIDKVFYVNAVSHSGNPSGVKTQISCTMGRRRHDFINNKDMIGSLKPGKSDDIFINKIDITPENYGTACDYNDTLIRFHQFYNASQTEVIEANASSEFYNHFYNNNPPPTPKKTTVSEPVAAKAEKAKGVVTGIKTYLNVRSGPSTNHAIIGKVFNGDGITIHKESGGFYNFTFNGNSGAWVSSNYIKKTSEPTSMEKNNKPTSSTYASSAPGAAPSGEFTINDIQYELNMKYTSPKTPDVVKARAKRLQDLVVNANNYMAQLYSSNYMDDPISVTKGGKPL